MISFCRDCVYKSRLLRGILVQHAVTCVYVAHSTLADESWIMFRVARQEGEFPNQLIKCLEMLRQAFLKQMKKGRYTRSHTQSLLLVLTLQAQSQEQSWTFVPSFFSAHPSIHSFVLYLVHWSISWPSTYWERALLKSLNSHIVLIVVFSFTSSVASADLHVTCKSLSVNNNNKKRSTVLADVTGIHRWLHCARERGWDLETGTCSVTTQ